MKTSTVASIVSAQRGAYRPHTAKTWIAAVRQLPLAVYDWQSSAEATHLRKRLCLFWKKRRAEDPFAVFLAPGALAINQARQQHLASLGLDLTGKKVLEVGAGIGLHSPFFIERGCEVTVTDGRPENVAEITRRLPTVKTSVVNMEVDRPLHELGSFDIVYCYGLLYHLANPERALARLAEVCQGQLLLETAVSPGNYDELLLLRDPDYYNQAVSGVGCRPTRLWVLNRLRMLFGYAYIPRTQPDHVDFPGDWVRPPMQLMYRSIFVGSRTSLDLLSLDDQVPKAQQILKQGS